MAFEIVGAGFGPMAGRRLVGTATATCGDTRAVRDSHRDNPPFGFPAEDEQFMRVALSEAVCAEESGDVPVGAIVVRDGRIIGRGHNQRELLGDPTAHAEMVAISAAAALDRTWRLHDCTLFVTLEPCVMCAGAIVAARMPRLVFGATDPKAGACGSVYDVVRDARLNHRVETAGGVLAGECGRLLRRFFERQRAAGKK